MKKLLIVCIFFAISGVLIYLHLYPLVPLILLPLILGYICFLQYRVVSEHDLKIRKDREKALRNAIWGIFGIFILGFAILFVIYGVMAK